VDRPIKPGSVIPLSGGFEYHLNSPDGVQAVEQRLNAWGERGWRLTGVTACNGNFAVMERPRA
jgi:hypothetical protein